MRPDIMLGIATVLMALVGGAVSLHAPTKWPWRITYAALFAVLGAISVVYVIKQSNEGALANHNLSEAMGKLERSTTRIADMTALNAQLQDKLMRQTETITALSRENIAATTGGESYCAVIASPADTGEFWLYATAMGSSPLHGIFAEMVDGDVAKTFFSKGSLSFQDIRNFTTYFPPLPFLAASSMHSSLFLGKIPMGAGVARNLHFNFTSMNGVWNQDLSLRRVNGRWLQASRVRRELKGGHLKTIYTSVPDDFPKVNGNVDW